MLVTIRALRRMRGGVTDKCTDPRAFMSDLSQASYDEDR